jgi:hypothetical protein
LLSITPLVAMIEYLTKWIYNNDNSISYELDERKKIVAAFLENEIIFKQYYNRESFQSVDERIKCVKDFISRISKEHDKNAKEYFLYYNRILENLFTTHNSQFIIEEPEQNLFPETQRDLVYYLLHKCFNKNKNENENENRLTLTTHSPYVLYALNNCMMAGLVSDKMNERELQKLKCYKSKISPSNVSIYEIREGCVNKTIQGEDGLISDNYFDQQMKELMDDFYLMLNYYAND